MDIERDHRIAMLTGCRYGSEWFCRCGAHGECHGSPVIGWALHLRQILSELETDLEY